MSVMFLLFSRLIFSQLTASDNPAKSAFVRSLDSNSIDFTVLISSLLMLPSLFASASFNALYTVILVNGTIVFPSASCCATLTSMSIESLYTFPSRVIVASKVVFPAAFASTINGIVTSAVATLAFVTTFKILLSLEVTDTTSPDLTFITLTSLLNVPTLRFGIFLSICGDVSLFAVTVTGIVTVADGVVLLSTFNFVSPASAVSIASRLNVLSV